MANLCPCLLGEECSIPEKELKSLIKCGEFTKVFEIRIETGSIPFLGIFLERFGAWSRHARKLRKTLPRIAAEQSVQHVICEETFESGIGLNELICQTYSFLARVVEVGQRQEITEIKYRDRDPGMILIDYRDDSVKFFPPKVRLK